MVGSNILTRLESLSLSDDNEKTAKCQIYHTRLMFSGERFLCKFGYVVLKDFEGKRFLVLRRIKDKSENILTICLKCTDARVLSSVKENDDLTCLISDYCIHAIVTNLIWSSDDLDPGDDLTEEEFVEVLDVKKNYAALVVPSADSVTKPGVVVLTAKTLKPRCDKCEGKTCSHLTLHKIKYDVQEQDEKEINPKDKIKVSPAGLKEMNAGKSKPSQPSTDSDVQIEDEPSEISAKDSDVTPEFKIPFPLTSAMKNKLWQDSLRVNIFPEKKMVPKFDEVFRCKCGYGVDPRDPFAMNWVANDPVIIHHTRFVPDGRTTRLIAYYRPMLNPEGFHLPPPCIHKYNYDGSQDLLLRTSKTGRSGVAHFVSFELLFKYFFDLFENGTSQKGFLQSNTIFNSALFDRKLNFDWFVFEEAYGKFVFMLDTSNKAFECNSCPKELEKGDTEENYKGVIDVHIADGIDMGNITNMVKGIPEDDLFGVLAPEGSKERKGVEAPDRTYLNNKKQRDIISTLLEDRNDQKSLKAALKKLNAKGKSAVPRDEHLEIVHRLIEHIDDIATRVPIGYLEMLYEIHLETPISALVNSQNDEAFMLLKDYLNEEDDIFSKLEETKLMFEEFPVISLWIERIKKFTNKKFLPKQASELILSILKFNDDFLIRAHDIDLEDPGPNIQGEVRAEIYPGLPQHTANEKFHADKYKDKGEIKSCTKIYPEASGITGGLGHLTCQHGITKGYTAMKNGESPALFAKTIFKRLPKRVKAERRVFVYDNCCNFHKFTLRRYPWRSRRWTFVIDRHHYKNHKLCSSAYNMDSYKWLDGVNSQVCEQRNNQLRKMSKSLAHMSFKNYLRNLTL